VSEDDFFFSTAHLALADSIHIWLNRQEFILDVVAP
jgi:hypothetical protein